MNRVAQMSAEERADVFAEAANRKGLPEAVIEKDFWVCWMLKQLFSIEALSGRLLFKGGTSLSKIFHAIRRFSEDIDLAVDYAALGFRGDRDPYAPGLSRSKQVKLLGEMITECQQYIRGEFAEHVTVRCRELLGSGGGWTLKVDEQDPNVVRFLYPSGTRQFVSYMAPQVVLELGTHAEFVPRDRFVIRAFAAEEFPKLMSEPDVEVAAILAKRTFWEKVTILHAEYHRPAERPLPGRYSRHYYDVAMLTRGVVKDEALADLDLLERVVRHKQTFYPSAWCRYDLARPGTLRLAPSADRVTALRQDYREMAVMLFDEPPRFEEIVNSVAEFEREVNSLRFSEMPDARKPTGKQQHAAS
ncbi:MAG: nucleotidyl transferase AbiEii/AbiGii toxin family protein [Acidobacteria bacterium]|nr:nucleotidyl transferase AbiEii/AbiGii toxin family protein [Acidobacteriota bacterium]